MTRSFITSALALFCLLLGLATAVAQTGGVIAAIRVEGNQRIEPETVISYMKLAPGDPFDPARIDASLKALFATGLFADVTLRREGNDLVVRVVENPIINRIAFEGNRRIKDDVLANEVQLKPRRVYTRTRVQADVARIVEIYRRSGRFAATVEPKVIQLPQNRVDLVFEIDEGPKTEVKRITFIGNRHFDDAELRDVIRTKETRWYRFLTSDDTYDPDRLKFDRELLRRFYLAKGYADFRVDSVVAELTRDRSGFFITFTITEGERYRFGKIEIKNHLRDLDPARLRTRVRTQEGEWYDANLVEDTVQALTDAVAEKGFAFVDVEPRTQRHRKKRTIDVTYEIGEGPRVFVERIEINGNVRTLDKVIRREFKLAEGDAFNAAKLRLSEKRIRNLGFFEDVQVHTKPGSSPDKAVIEVDVKEQSTGSLSFGFGVSSIDGPLADSSIQERNLLGRGQSLKLSLRASGRRQEIDLSFTEPYFLDRDLSAGFDVFRRKTDVTNQGTFDEDAIGTVLRMGYSLTERIRHSINYTLRRNKITNVDASASRFIRDQEGSFVTSGIGHSLSYDTRDSRIAPTKGFLIRFNQDFAGLGGRTRYVRHRVTGRIHFPIREKWVATLEGNVGNIFGFAGSDVRINDRFLIGNSTLRGFAVAGIGPRDIVTNDALGGNTFLTGSAQIDFPLGLPNEFNVKGRLFTDVGTLFGIDSSGANIADKSSLRMAAGFGVSYVSPLGPIAIDFAIPVLKESFDDTQLIRFNFGTRF